MTYPRYQTWTVNNINDQLDATITILLIFDCPKHVELIQRSIKLLLLHPVGHLYYSPTMMIHGQTQIKWTVNFGYR